MEITIAVIALEYHINREIHIFHIQVLLHMNGKFTMGILKQGFVLNRHSISISRCTSKHEADLTISVISYISSSMG